MINLKVFTFITFAFLLNIQSVIAQTMGNRMCLIRTSPDDKYSDTCGSGFFIADNTIMTAYHVINRHDEYKAPIRIEYNNKMYTHVHILYKQPHQDLAILNVDVEDESWFDISDTPSVEGEEVIAYGFPRGKWVNHIAKGRIINPISKVYLNKMESYQTSTTIWVEPGMSGGPLVNNNKKVIGVLQSKTLDNKSSFYTNLVHLQEALNKLKRK